MGASNVSTPCQTRHLRCLYKLAIGLLLSFIAASGFCAEADSSADKAPCKHNLRLIHDAIQAYRVAHKDLPPSLSELYPSYIADPDILYCPEARKRGLTSIAVTGRRGFSDPKTSYFYEFNNVPLESLPGKTNRDWKRAQMGQLGSVVPIVRCLVHERPLNLSFGGDIYESALDWEYKFTNVVEYAHLMEEYLLTPAAPVRVVDILPRDSAAGPSQLDLSDYYNASLSKPWVTREPTHHLARFPAGVHEFDGIRFDARGIIQLSSRALVTQGERFPDRVEIPVNSSCREMHFLLGSSLTAKDGTQAGRLAILFGDGQGAEVPLRVGTHLRATWQSSEKESGPTAASIGWRAPAPEAAQLFHVTWPNPRPAVEIRSVNCISAMSDPDFFVVAVSILQ
jgi:hypothetical protein